MNRQDAKTAKMGKRKLTAGVSRTGAADERGLTQMGKGECDIGGDEMTLKGIKIMQNIRC